MGYPCAFISLCTFINSTELKNNKPLSWVPRNLSYSLANQHFEDPIELLNVNIAPSWVCKCVLQPWETGASALPWSDQKNKGTF